MTFNFFGYSLVTLFCASFISYVLLWPNSFASRQLNRPVVVLIGRISYGIYLFHPLCLQLVIAVGRAHGVVHDKLMVPFALAATIAVSWTSFNFYEKPIIKWGRQKAKQHETTTRMKIAA